MHSAPFPAGQLSGVKSEEGQGVACLESKGGDDAAGPDQVVLAQVVQGLVQDDGSSLEPHRLLELDALELLQILHRHRSASFTRAWLLTQVPTNDMVGC